MPQCFCGLSIVVPTVNEMLGSHSHTSVSVVGLTVVGGSHVPIKTLRYTLRLVCPGHHRGFSHPLFDQIGWE